MSLSFKYRKETFKGKEAFFPKIPILLHNKEFSFETPALLDSGAKDIFIPKSMATALNLETKKEFDADSWSGTFKVWESSINIVIGRGSQVFRKTLPCLIAEEKSENEEAILGRSFFEFFKITFDELNKKTLLQKNELN